VVKICELEGFGLKLLIGIGADSGGVAAVRLLGSRVRIHLRSSLFRPLCLLCTV
jgi:hypothetical protein